MAEIGADTFSAAATRVVDYLATHTPISDWSVSRVSDGVQVHLHVHHETLIDVGDELEWSDTLCKRMVEGASHVVPDTVADPVFSGSAHVPTVRAYAGFPIVDADGSMFGVLCGVDRQPLPDEAAVDPDLVEIFSDLLSTNLRLARIAEDERRSARTAAALAETDALTGLMNRRGWDVILRDAQRRVTAFGDRVALAVVDLDGLKRLNDTLGHTAGDDAIRSAADALLEAAGPRDRIARYGGDEFAILTQDIGLSEIESHYETFVRALADHGVSASVGAARSVVDEALHETFDRADERMYAVKRLRTAV